MASNFDFLLNDKHFKSFAQYAIVAEKLFCVDVESSVAKCRKAMEIAVKWMYKVDEALKEPYWDNKLATLMTEPCFKEVVDPDLYKKLDYIRLLGNQAVHTDKAKISEQAAMLALDNLHNFMDFIAYCYSEYEYVQTTFDPELVYQNDPSYCIDSLRAELEDKSNEYEAQLENLIKENASLKSELTAKRHENQQSYVQNPLNLTEFETRKLYIDVMLERAGWRKGKNWLEEVELHGMPNRTLTGYADYVLYGDNGKILAIVEAKKSCKDVTTGRQQAKLYADIIEYNQNVRPVIFLTNGFETRIIDGQYSERIVSEIYSKRDLEKLFNLRATRENLTTAFIKKEIAGRYYQQEAIRAVCEAFQNENRRKALLVMATGSGKTRTIISLCDVLLRSGWIKNVLFLADRTSLVTQAKRSFVNLLPDMSTTNLVEDKDNFDAHCVFSTYNTMMNCIDNVSDGDGRIYTAGHFDLIICDEAHRSIYNKYRDIFNYFDALLIGLTATPKDDIDKNTYEVFELPSGLPTFEYSLKKAVNDHFLVDFITLESKLKFLEKGIVYDDLSDEEKEEYEKNFAEEDGSIPDSIDSSEMNTWIFNEGTIREVLADLMTRGIKIDYGNKLGKTIIFAKNHNHANKILEVFNKEYPNYVDFAKVIDIQTGYAQSAIDEFSDPAKLPQIAISVDMLDTGIDIPEILNLVFFKKVKSKAKFWQMIGRGTRLCSGLVNGNDKKHFYIFDFCSNFDFFRVSQGTEAENLISIQGSLFHLKFEIAYKLQSIEYQNTQLKEFRDRIVNEMLDKVKELNRDNFSIRQHLRIVEQYSVPESYSAITFEDTLAVRNELAQLIEPEQDDPEALRFDYLLYGIELASLQKSRNNRNLKAVKTQCSKLAEVATIPAVAQQLELIDKIINTSFLDDAKFDDFEYIRNALRDLMHYIEKKKRPIININFEDLVTESKIGTFVSEIDESDDYKAKAERLIKQNQDNAAIKKLKSNIPLTADDVKELEKILWNDAGTKEDYVNTFGELNLGEFVRGIVGLDMNSAKEAFAEFLVAGRLNSNQIYFLDQIINYIVMKGFIKDMKILQGAPFNNHGSITQLFQDLSVWQSINKVIKKINANAKVEA